MNKVRFEEMFPWELARAMAEAPICYLPLGVLEWHGEHNAVGLDGIKAHAVCEEAARRSGALWCPRSGGVPTSARTCRTGPM